MPNSKSAEKRLRQNEVLRNRNKSIKSAMKSQIKKVVSAVEAGDIEKAEQEFRVASKRLDRAGAIHIIHRNAAARKKSRLQSLIKKAKQKIIADR